MSRINAFLKKLFYITNTVHNEYKCKEICILGKSFFVPKFKNVHIINYLKMLYAKLCGKKFIIINACAGLGDYVQIRNYFKLIKKAYEKNGDKVFICVLIIDRYKDFCKKYDLDSVDIFFDLLQFDPLMKNDISVFKLFSYDLYINFHGGYSYSEKINSVIKAKNIHDTKRDHLKYTSLNIREFMEPIVNVEEFDLHFNKIYKAKDLKDKNYVLLVPIAYTAGNLSVSQVVELSKYLISKNKKVMIFSLDGEKPNIFDKVYAELNNDEKEFVINGINKFATYDIPDVVNSAEFVITPNTSVYHFAMALDKKTICLTPNYVEYIDYNNKNVNYVIEEKISDIKSETIIREIEKFIN